MKAKFLVLFSLLSIILLSTSQSSFKTLPPGTVKLTDSLFIDQYPVKVIDYLEFLRSLNTFWNRQFTDSLRKLPKYGLNQVDIEGLKSHFQGDSLLYIEMLTRTWVTYSHEERRYDVDFRLKSSQYYQFPIVNISFEQMQMYCQWRTDMVMLYYATNCKTEKQRRKYPWNFKYRLIKRKEWEKALSVFIKDIVRNEDPKNLSSRPENIVKPYPLDKKKAFNYNVSNAAETLENAIVTFNFKWNDAVKVGNISYFQFENPSDWISFRCICEILPE